MQISVGAYTAPSIINNAGTVAGVYSVYPPSKSNFRLVMFVRDADGTRRDIGPGGTSVLGGPGGMNAAGAVTGFYVDLLTGVIHGFVQDPAGNFLSFDVPSATSTRPHGINAGGAVTGSWATAPSPGSSPVPNHGFLRNADGTITSFDAPESISTAPVSINAIGVITGAYQTADGTYHGFVRDPAGDITSFDPPGSTGTSPVSINYAGTIAGSYTKADGRTYGFVRDSEGTITSFDSGTPASINSKGVITGSGGNSGFVRTPDGAITLLDQPTFCTGSVLPRSINEGGVIAGYCLSGAGSQTGWVRFP
jgi:hypothetical protein